MTLAESREAMADLCSMLASDRSQGDASTIPLPRPGSPECDEIFLGAWAAFRHVTTEIGHQIMHARDNSVRRQHDLLDAFVCGRDAIPAYLRWAETEAMIRAGEWEGGPVARRVPRGMSR